MPKTAIGASLPLALFVEFQVRIDSHFPGGKTGLIKEALRAYFEANPLSTEQKLEVQTRYGELVKAII